MKRVKAVALYSGGLDSILAVKTMMRQGVKVEALNFMSPFCLCEGKRGCTIAETAKNLGVPIKRIPVDQDYLEIVRNPKHGYGRYMNPCIDCRIYMFKRAKEYAENTGAQIIFTGEVIGERPMSQRRDTLTIIEKEADLKGKILRPLSAKNFPDTEAEIQKWVDRDQLYDIKGRSRKKQIDLAQQFGIKDYPCPSGGCLLTYKEFAAKIKDFLNHENRLDFQDIALLKIGRHFRHKKNKIIVGRNESENKLLLSLKRKTDPYFEAIGCGSPITVLQGPDTPIALKMAASVTARYSDCKDNRVTVMINYKDMSEVMKVKPLDDEILNTIKIKWSKS